MPPYGEPDWATPGDTSNITVTQQAGTGSATTPAAGGGRESMLNQARRNAKLMIVLLSIVDFGLAAMMAALGITSLIEMNFGALDEVTEAFLAVYMVIFAVLLALYEFIWWSPIPALNKTFRKNFGFMYGLKGKGFYLIFIAFLCLGLWKDDQTAIKGLDWATGFAWLATGLVHIFMSMCWPEVNEMYKPATAGLTESQENVV